MSVAASRWKKKKAKGFVFCRPFGDVPLGDVPKRDRSLMLITKKHGLPSHKVTRKKRF